MAAATAEPAAKAAATGPGHCSYCARVAYLPAELANVVKELSPDQAATGWVRALTKAAEAVVECRCGCRYCDAECQRLDAKHHRPLCCIVSMEPAVKTLAPYYGLSHRYLGRPLRIDPADVEVRASPVAGRGLFAARDIRAGAVLSIMPLDGFFKLPARRIGESLPTSLAKDYRFDIVPGLLLEASKLNSIVRSCYSNPHGDARPHFLCHMVNDAAYPTNAPKVIDRALRLCKLPKTTANIEQMPLRGRKQVAAVLVDYWQASLEGNNAVIGFGGCPVALVARRDIRKDEEIFVTYGPAYWLQHCAGVDLGVDIVRWLEPATAGAVARQQKARCHDLEAAQMRLATTAIQAAQKDVPPGERLALQHDLTSEMLILPAWKTATTILRNQGID